MFAVVLGGGNALGAYHGGVAEALADAGVEPGWVAGSSIGAVCAALIAGNAPERRMRALREFWRRATKVDLIQPWLPPQARAGVALLGALGSRLLGRPELFQPRLFPGPGYFTQEPMREVLLELVDWDRLNAGSVRLSLLTVNVETGEEVTFDTSRERVTVDHVIASASLMPDFLPARIGDLLLVDGGLSANVPADLVLGEPPGDEALAVLVADPFPGAAPPPRGLLGGFARQSDLLFAMQTRRTMRAMQQLWSARPGAPPASCYWIECAPATEDEVPLKGYDFSSTSLDRRWAQGRRDTAAALALWRAEPPSGPGLRVHPPIRGTRPEQARNAA